MSYSLFFALPAPLKVLAILVGGFFFVGVKNVQMDEELQVQEAAEARAEVRAAQKQPAAGNVNAMVRVTVNADGTFNMGANKLSAVQLENNLKALAAVQPGLSVTLNADKQVPAEKLTAATKLCQKAGVKKIVTRRPE